MSNEPLNSITVAFLKKSNSGLLALKKIESLQLRLNEANKWSDVDFNEFVKTKEKLDDERASNKVLRDSLTFRDFDSFEFEGKDVKTEGTYIVADIKDGVIEDAAFAVVHHMIENPTHIICLDYAAALTHKEDKP